MRLVAIFIGGCRRPGGGGWGEEGEAPGEAQLVLLLVHREVGALVGEVGAGEGGLDGAAPAAAPPHPPVGQHALRTAAGGEQTHLPAGAVAGALSLVRRPALARGLGGGVAQLGAGELDGRHLPPQQQGQGGQVVRPAQGKLPQAGRPVAVRPIFSGSSLTSTGAMLKPHSYE
jgi:hypothetical protein